VNGASLLSGVLETCLYHDGAERDAVERFYTEVLGLRAVARWTDGIAFRVAGGLLLLFDRGLLAQRESAISAHGSTGPGHACLLARGADAYEEAKRALADRGVAISHEQDWERGRRSFYFSDPAGNLLEIADGDLWPG
jgi:catechol 2,3-dioxygenase-like lactoylglutathione lyase family enzyme